MRVFLFALLLGTIFFTILPDSYSASNESARNSRSLDDIIVEEIQADIDRLRKNMKDLTEKVKATTSNNEVAELKKEFDNMKKLIEDNYSKLDSLSKDLKETYRQKIDEVQKGMLELQNNLNDRVSKLETKLETMIINQVIGFIMDGQTNTASKTFKSTDFPDIHIYRIVEEAYNRNISYCKNILNFIDALDNIESRPQALDILFDQVLKYSQLFDFDGSECAFRIGYQTKLLLDKIRYGDPLGYLWSVRRKLPTAVHYFTTWNSFIYITREAKECTFPSDNDRNEYYYKSYLGDFNKWEVMKKTSVNLDPVYFRLKDRLEGNVLEADLRDGGKVYLGNQYNDGEIQYWKPIVISNEKIHLLHQKTQKYLSYKPVKTCYEYSLSDKPTPFFVHF